ncbi:LOW QUALITY PROTEIN: hypothetical protein OSB04_019024 [Centaurea solstitialis]|uniref:DUF4219 domain-containing protein n=1 Tax=Centaurea solstitialis TaxID=347529 RepID=A0AA38T2W7_9ASTR|nr:LOW QUALITY PROTEIN: hypothetical protein OSB04_019024 [Centaurea solstitialis]
MALQAKDNYFDTGSAGKPPRFNKDNFALWKTRMELFLSGSDPQIPYFLENGPHVPTQTVHAVPAANGQPAIPARELVKPVTNWNDEDRRLVNIDTKARSLIANTKVLQSSWNQEKSSWFYESFIHQKDETLSQIHQRFKCLLIDLKTIGTVYPNSEVITKFMEALPEQWEIYTSCLTMSKEDTHTKDTKDSKSTSIALVSDSVPAVATPSSVTITELESSDSDMSTQILILMNLLHYLLALLKSLPKRETYREENLLLLLTSLKQNLLIRLLLPATIGKGHFANDCRYKKNQFAPSSTKSSSKNPKYQRLKEKYNKMKFQRKGKGLIAEDCDWDNVSSDESSNEEDTTPVALMAVIEEPNLALMAKIEEVPEEVPKEVPTQAPEASTSATESSSQDKGIW